MRDFVNMDAVEFAEISPRIERFATHAAFTQEGDMSQVLDPDRQSIEEARGAAKDYAKAVNSNARSRQYLLSNEDAKDGVASALAWLQRKRKSALKN